jgi:uncharacterized protein YoxC
MHDMTVTDYLLRKVLTHDDKLDELETKVGVVKDYADRINTYTNELSEDVDTISQTVSGVLSRLQEVDSELASELAPAVDGLGGIATKLDAVANPTAPENPIPTPEEPTDPAPEEPTV